MRSDFSPGSDAFPVKIRAWLPAAVLAVMMLAYAVLFGVMSIRQHDGLRTHVFDLGNVDQTVWNTLHGRPLHFTTQPAVGENRLGMHVEPILFLVSGLYALHPDPRTLLVIQTVALALGAWPLWLLARRRLRAPWIALVFPFAYLMWPAVQATNLFEFHAVALAPPLLLAAFYFMDRAAPQPADSRGASSGNWLPYSLFLLLALSCKEDVSLLVVLLGLYITVARRRPVAGLITAAVGAAWFGTAVYAIVPHFRPSGSPFLQYYEGLGDSPLSIGLRLLGRPADLATLLFTPENGRALVALLLPMAGLPLLGFPFWLLLGPSLGITLLSGNPLMHRMERYHYAAPMIPVMAAAAVFGAAWLVRRLSGRDEALETAAKIALAFALLAGSLWYGVERGFTPLARSFNWPRVTEHDHLLDEIASTIPADAVITAQPNLFPHVSHRERAYFWPDPRPSEYKLLDVTDPTFYNRDDAHQALKRQVQAGSDYGWTTARDGYLLLEKGQAGRPLPDEFFTFARVDNAQPRYSIVADFGDAVRFLGFTPVFEREEEVQFELFFQSLRPLDRDYAVTLYLAEPDGTIVGGTDRVQPVLVWYPTSRWNPGETIRVLANTITWWTGNRAEYAVALGVHEGEDIWSVGARLAPRVREGEWLTPLLSDRTLLRLMRFGRRWDLPELLPELRSWVAPLVDQRLGLDFGGRFELTGYLLAARRLSPGQSIDLTLVWKALARYDVDYTVFVQVFDADGRMVAQQDEMPGQGRLPTSSWLPGEYVSDGHRLALPPELPAGTYRVAFGLYRADTGERLATGPSDSVTVDGGIEIVR